LNPDRRRIRRRRSGYARGEKPDAALEQRGRTVEDKV